VTPYSLDEVGRRVRVEIFGRAQMTPLRRLHTDGRWLCSHPMMRDGRAHSVCQRVATHIAQRGTDKQYVVPLCGRHAAGWQRTASGNLLDASIPAAPFLGVRRLVWK